MGLTPFKAWLSDAANSPSTTFVQSALPYVRVDGVIVANNWADLTDGTLQAPIYRDEAGAQPPPTDPFPFNDAWTGTDPDGTGVAEHCVAWTSGDFINIGQLGDYSLETDPQWTGLALAGCSTSARLYCFQQ